MIILEGSDGTGKTTAAHKLVGITGWKYEHMGVPPESWDYFYDYLDLVKPCTIYDRFHLGGLVYGNLLGLHPTKYNETIVKRLCHNLHWRKCRTAIIYASDSDWFKEHLVTNAKEELYKIEKILDANRIYKALAESGEVCQIGWDISGGDFPTEEVLKEWIS
jgi:hypothetical protein